MKRILLSLLIIFVVTVATVTSANGSSPKHLPKCECICPTLDTLIKEKEAADKEAHQELGRIRRQTLRDKLSWLLAP